MPRRPKVLALPSEVKEWLDAALIANNFGQYQALSDELAARGYSIGKSALHSYGTEFERKLASVKLATDQARAIVQAAPDDDNAVNDSLIRLVQEQMFSILIAMQPGEEGVSMSPGDLAKIARGIAQLGRASVVQKEFAAKTREKIDKALRSKEAAADAGGDKSRADILREIREEVYGLVG